MALDCTGTISTDISGNPVCSGGAWVSSPEPLYELYELLNAAFSQPENADISAAFMIGIGLPLICYQVAWAYGVVVNWFDSRNID